MQYLSNSGSVIAGEEIGSEGSTTYIYNKDIQNSTKSLLDTNGDGVTAYDYSDFGETTITGDQNVGNEVAYTGGIYDESTGLYYLNARYYDPENGRFLSEDTYRGEAGDPDTWHLYAYCNNDPVNYVDPSGHKKEWVSKKKGKVYRSKKTFSELKVCTDGPITYKVKNKKRPYGDRSHGKETACFGKYVAADQIPYIVVPPEMKAYKYSSGVIANKKNGNYLYCVVAEIGPRGRKIEEVSIYAAWKMQSIKLPKNNKVEKKHNIAGSNDYSGSWEIILFQKSSPQGKGRTGWKYKNAKSFRKQIKALGKGCYIGTGKCLN